MYRDEQDMNSRNMHVCIIKLSPPANLQEILWIYFFLLGGEGEKYNYTHVAHQLDSALIDITVQ